MNPSLRNIIQDTLVSVCANIITMILVLLIAFLLFRMIAIPGCDNASVKPVYRTESVTSQSTYEPKQLGELINELDTLIKIRATDRLPVAVPGRNQSDIR